MSSFLNKAKAKLDDVIESSKNKGDNSQSDNYGHHSSNTGNKLDPTIDSDLDNRNNPTSRVGGYGETQAIGHHSTTQGPGGYGSSDTYGSNTNTSGYDDPRSANYGPHSSNLMNKADPRVDSDRDGRNDPTSRVGGYGNTQRHGDTYNQSGTGGFGTTDTGYGRQTGLDSTGPGHTGYAGDTTTGYSGDVRPGHTGHTGGLAANTTTGTDRFNDNSGYSSTSNTYDNPRSGNTGPHNNNLLNKFDPRVDSDNDNRNNPTSRVGGYGGQTDDFRSGDTYATTGQSGGYRDTTRGYGETTTGSYGGTTEGYGHGTTGATGKHGVGNTGYDDSSYTPGSGNTTKTAGPHNSNILNKLDPRVDADMDGSKTYGGNATYR